MAAIRIDGLRKRFGDVVAVDGLSLTVETGEVFGLLGPNGAGKSTTINALLDYVRPSAGTVTVLGYDAQADPVAVRRRTGILPEGFDLYHRLTARRHVAFAAESKRAGGDVDAALAAVGLTDVADRAVGGFSTGMRKRLALGMALVGDPELVVLDEPATGLDPHGMREVRELIRERRSDGATVLLSSHLLSEVDAVADRVGILDAGSLVAVDTVDGLRSTVEREVTLVVTVDRAVEGVESMLVSIEGVAEVSVDGRTIRVACADATAKHDVIDRIERAGPAVTDLATEEAGLDDLFAAYTSTESQ